MKIKKKIYYYNLWHLYHKNFFGNLIFRGRKLFAFKFFLFIKYQLKIREKHDPFLLFLISMLKLTPKIFLKPINISATSKGVPLPISLEKSIKFTTLWTIRLLKKRDKRIQLHFLCDLLITALYNRGEAFHQKQDYHKTACNNRYLLRFFK